ncbi:hypothetical protein [Pisciglobus halotolerans]|uniref:Phage gp6-like head-tail connector protein n=1 Tax=Pisciglobus halotolerans TaxID=745365 RepID=A0A1I3C2H7_9LACT|nr:hypothetical protein [Pisciglobus halotolerans]SFH68650.1 hypothetical protein SAMN04489868_11239 [Pisciglobus halotolerans]
MNTNDLIAELLPKVKRHLRITWEYQDDEVKDMVEEGMAYFESIAGPCDFEQGLALTLLKDYCRYYWNGSVSFFEENYRHMLLNLQITNAKKRVER